MIEYIRENENVCETVFACSCGTHVENFKPNQKNNGRKSRDTVPLTEIFLAWVF